VALSAEMKIRIIKTPPIDPVHGIEEGQKYSATRLENRRANVQVVSRETGEAVCLEPWEWEEIEDWQDDELN
jgi:hypothetical protein